MEEAMGADFSAVRVHVNGTVARAARDINAEAFTHGQDIYFSEGQYQPGTAAGKRLLAHELTHTVQQRGSSEAVHGNTRISEPGEPLEQEAEAVAAQVSSGAAPGAQHDMNEVGHPQEHNDNLTTLSRQLQQSADSAGGLIQR
jgi:hypothetical protein